MTNHYLEGTKAEMQRLANNFVGLIPVEDNGVWRLKVSTGAKVKKIKLGKVGTKAKHEKAEKNKADRIAARKAERKAARKESK